MPASFDPKEDQPSPERTHLDFVVSTCISRDAEIWRFAAPKILEYIESKNYSLLVPSKEASVFRRISPSNICVIPEQEFLEGRDLSWVQSELPSSLAGRAGWYYQQLLKLDFFRQAETKAIGLIWDADTIPLRRMSFIDDSGCLILRLGVHKPPIHDPYFRLIEDLLGISRVIEGSFISQCMPSRTKWVHELCENIEMKSGQNWAETILNFISKNPSSCGFSEYETLGTFVHSKYPHEIRLKQGKYYRPANHFCEPADLDRLPFSRFQESQEYLAFDSYLDKSRNQITGLNLGCGNTRMTALDGNQSINVDKFYLPAVDIVIDLNNGLPFADFHFTHIVAHNILEHVDDLLDSLVEIDRVLKPGGILQVEVPHVGSYNHGTDVTHQRGLTFDSFNFLLPGPSYLFPRGNGPFRYKLLTFNRENVINGTLVRESLDSIPVRGSYPEWIDAVRSFKIPGTFGFIFQKI